MQLGKWSKISHLLNILSDHVDLLHISNDPGQCFNRVFLILYSIFHMHPHSKKGLINDQTFICVYPPHQGDNQQLTILSERGRSAVFHF